MKAISLHQPWASLVADGIKAIETRSWRAHASAIGQRIAIHAAKTRSGRHAFTGRRRRVEFDDLPFGAIVATAVIDRCVQVNHIFSGPHEMSGDAAHRGMQVSESPDGERFSVDRWGHFDRGRWLWILRDVERLDRPVSMPGRQGFWSLPPEITVRIRKQVIA